MPIQIEQLFLCPTCKELYKNTYNPVKYDNGLDIVYNELCRACRERIDDYNEDVERVRHNENN